MDYDSKEWTKVPLETIKTPQPHNMVCGPSYWIVTPDECVLRFRESSWQHNAYEDIIKHMIETIHVGCRIEYLPVAFVPHDCRDYA